MADLIALSEVELELGRPTEGWAGFLSSRGISIVVDDIGRLAIARTDAKLLFVERAQVEARGREVMAERERQFVEADKAFREGLPHGVSWDQIPLGVSPSAALLATAKAEQPRRRSLVDDFYNRPTPNAIPQTFGPTPDRSE
jgi:hypothetical protein